MAHISLSIALSHLIAFLTSPLAATLSQEHIDRVRICLDVNLTRDFEKIWCPENPKQYSGARCLSLSLDRLPPRPLLTACHAARIRWSQWMTALGGQDMDVFVDPGCVSVRKAGKWGGITTIWSATALPAVFESAVVQKTTTDEEVEELFSLIEQERAAPTWMTPLIQQFPSVPTLRVDTSCLDARSSSRASTHSSASSSSDSEFSGPPSLVDTDSDSLLSSSSARSKSSVYVPPARRAAHAHKISLQSFSVYSDDEDDVVLSAGARSRQRQGKVHIDATKVEVTPYDGGKTTVLTGGVMLGMPAVKKARV